MAAQGGGGRESQGGRGNIAGASENRFGTDTHFFASKIFFERRCAGEGEVRRRGAPQGGAVGGEKTQNVCL
jgi:hypothetical protein